MVLKASTPIKWRNQLQGDMGHTLQQMPRNKSGNERNQSAHDVDGKDNFYILVYRMTT